MKREDLVAWLRAREAYAEELHSHDAVRYREAADALERLATAEGELVEAVARTLCRYDYSFCELTTAAQKRAYEGIHWPAYSGRAVAVIPLILERAAGVADKWAKTEADIEKSHSPTTARAIAAIVSDTGAKIAAAIRSLGRPST